MRSYCLSVIKGERNDALAVLLRGVLFCASLVYSLCLKVVLFLYRIKVLPRKSLGVPVVSVGNLTMGGTGKTPVVIYLSQMLRAQGLKPAILLRGYMARKGVNGGFVSDEAEVLRQTLKDIPVVVNPDRVLGGIQAVERFKPDVIILDDGFQHWKLFRDLDIVLIDAVDPFGTGRLLPCGLLREPLSSLRRADLVVLTKTNRKDPSALRDILKKICPNVPLVESVHRPRSLTRLYIGEYLNITHLNRPVIAFCGIGDPLSFKSMLVDLGADVKEFISYMDHHSYDRTDLMKLRAACDVLGLRTLVTTRKDAVKLAAFVDFWRGYELLVLNIEIDIVQGQEVLLDGIHRLFHR